MNYLAHLYFSGADPQHQVGGLLGDFVKGPLCGRYPEGIETGIRRHRQIDTLCGELPAIGALVATIAPPWRRYAGIAIDVLFDHLLARRWSQFHPRSLDDVCAAFYQELARHRAWLPERARWLCDLAPQRRWLERYGEPEHMCEILERIGGRLRRPLSLVPLWERLQERPAQLEAAFGETMAACARLDPDRRL